MRARLIALLRAAPAALWTVLVALGGLAAAFLLGRSRARSEEADEKADAEGRRRVEAMRAAEAAGDDDEAQRRAFDGVRPGPKP